MTGHTKDRSSSSPNTKKQHHGINLIGLNRDHAELTDRGPHDQRLNHKQEQHEHQRPHDWHNIW